MAKIKVIQYQEAEGRLREIYDELIKKRGKLAEVHKIQSLRPESIVKHMDLYLEIMFSKSDLTRAEREMMAVVVSSANQCAYCQIHHAEALINYWKDEKKVRQLSQDYTKLNLNKLDILLCDFAKELTIRPGEPEKDIISKLKGEGMSDEALLDATLVISYFNFVNRIVLALQAEYTEEESTGYKY